MQGSLIEYLETGKAYMCVDVEDHKWIRLACHVV